MQTEDVTTLATAQEVFDHVARHLAGMKNQSMRSGYKLLYDFNAAQNVMGESEVCAYRGHEGAMCAVGCLLTDDEMKVGDKTIDTYVEDKSAPVVSRVASDGHLPARLMPHLGMLRSLQGVHDNTDNWAGEFDTDPGLSDEGIDELRKIALHHDLSRIALGEAFSRHRS